ncbi:SDR family NAD(P)-dependent oxidoreductase [Palleronia abyssalis]|uniref:Sulfoacetaldehyde reductase n=1 Tax=Palleronia abyssalis TaxID=1501240 RepID=A0A2R8BXP8_9RHOB|nr:SDR family oxidoreductase [Palleronia abyssalis]SPJ24957.1 Sulfoacetaldehyde reductase [Palleronia abyssalis]
MPPLALVTGASSGIGRELARIHAEKGGDLIVTARREDRLSELKKELETAHGVTVHVIAMDISGEDGARALYAAIQDRGLSPDILINNAGNGGQGKFIERELELDLFMVDLNIKTMVTLCHLIGADMVRRGSGRILNLGSTAGFIPGPKQATYFASKAFVNSFTMALDQEMRPKGVTCTVLAPGYVETEFADRADMHGTTMVKMGGNNPRDVATKGYDAMMKGQLVKIDKAALAFGLRFAVPFLPRRMLLKISERSQSK